MPKSTHRCGAWSRCPSLDWLPNFIDHVLSGLAFLHERKVIHRDIKPQNILFNVSRYKYSFFISDFGLVADVATAGSLAGTILYMAPEATRYGENDTLSDVYSFGITFLEILGRFCPIEGRLNVGQWREKLKVAGVENWREYRDFCPVSQPHVPEAQNSHSRIKSLLDNRLLRSFVRGLLEEKPSNRFSASKARLALLAHYAPKPQAPVQLPVPVPRPAPVPVMQRRPTGRRMEIPIRQGRW